MDHQHMFHMTSGLSTAGIIGTLAVTGLVGGAAHCIGMCGPFVLAQIEPGPGLAKIPRLVRAATLPYHLGRLTTYTILGAVAGGAGDALAKASSLAPVFSAFLLLAAAVFLFQALEGLGIAGINFPSRLTGKVGVALSRLVAPLLRRRLLKGFAFGVALGFLPCGFLYGALLAAAGTGGMAGGAAAMAAFAAGTMPSLMVVGCGAGALASHWRRWARAVLAPVQAVTAALLVFFAFAGGGSPF